MTVTVQKAREFLGTKFDDYSDEELQRIIDDLYFLANSLLDEAEAE